MFLQKTYSNRTDINDSSTFTFESEEIQAIINESGANDTAKHL